MCASKTFSLLLYFGAVIVGFYLILSRYLVCICDLPSESDILRNHISQKKKPGGVYTFSFQPIFNIHRRTFLYTRQLCMSTLTSHIYHKSINKFISSRRGGGFWLDCIQNIKYGYTVLAPTWRLFLLPRCRECMGVGRDPAVGQSVPLYTPYDRIFSICVLLLLLTKNVPNIDWPSVI